MTSIELLPDELLLDIFELLGVKDRGRCAQTSKRFRKVSEDETLWQKLNLDEKEVPSQFLELAISRGLKYLSFRCAKLSGHQNLPIDTKSVKYLNVSSYNSWGYKANEEELTALVSCFSSLEKLSLGFLSMKNPAIINCILQNRETLKVLDLTECRDLNLELIKDIVRNCDQLTEVSFWGNNLCQSSIAFICDNLTPTIEKINFSSSRLCSENLMCGSCHIPSQGSNGHQIWKLLLNCGCLFTFCYLLWMEQIQSKLIYIFVTYGTASLKVTSL